MISRFVDTYLKLTDDEKQQYVRARSKLCEPEREAIMEIETSWSREGRRLGRKEGMEKGIQKGLQKGRQEGRQEEALLLVSKLLSRRFGTVDNTMLERLKSLATEELEAFSTELLDSRNVADLEQWLKSRGH
jgi:flagellar biosynthesis/type III secretory pathway protein FliH